MVSCKLSLRATPPSESRSYGGAASFRERRDLISAGSEVLDGAKPPETDKTPLLDCITPSKYLGTLIQDMVVHTSVELISLLSESDSTVFFKPRNHYWPSFARRI
jgi:hypothetical protein